VDPTLAQSHGRAEEASSIPMPTNPLASRALLRSPVETAPLRMRPGDYDACRSALRAGSRSFNTASLLLPRRVAIPATALYAFCRSADDAIDLSPDPARGVREVTARLQAVYDARPEDRPVDRAFAAVVHAYAVPRAVPDALVEGFAYDAQGRQYETLDDTVAYAVRVASSIGVMMTLLMGKRRPGVVARACDLGIAMQLTNIARDVGEDAAAGRLYLPRAWMRQEGLDPERFMRAPCHGPGLAKVVRSLLTAAQKFYCRADLGTAMLPRDCRVAIRAARLLYADIGSRIARQQFDSIGRRAAVPAWRKAWLLVRSLPALWSPSPEPGPLECEPQALFLGLLRRICGWSAAWVDCREYDTARS
jgi:phytoene synthase